MKEIEKMLEVYEQTGSIRQTAKILHCIKKIITLCHYLKTFDQKSRALDGSVALNLVYQTLQCLYPKYYHQKPKEFVDLLFLFRVYNDLDHMIKIHESVIKQGLVPRRELLLNLLQQSESTSDSLLR